MTVIYLLYINRGSAVICDISEFTAGRQHPAAVWSARRLLWISQKSASSFKLSGNQCVCWSSCLLGAYWLHTDVHWTAFQVQTLRWHCCYCNVLAIVVAAAAHLAAVHHCNFWW